MGHDETFLSCRQISQMFSKLDQVDFLLLKEINKILNSFLYPQYHGLLGLVCLCTSYMRTMPNPMGISMKGDLYTYIHTSWIVQNVE